MQKLEKALWIGLIISMIFSSAISYGEKCNTEEREKISVSCIQENPCKSALASAMGQQWWGVVFPATGKFPKGKVQFRFRLLKMIENAFHGKTIY